MAFTNAITYERRLVMNKAKGIRKNAFLYYNDWAKEMLLLPDDLRLKIDDAVKKFVLYGEEPSDPNVLYSMFTLMRRRLQQDNEEYLAKCETNRRNIEQRYDRIRPYTTATDNDNDNDKKKKNSTRKSVTRFTPPTLEEVKQYITENGYNLVDADSYYNHYEAIGWKVGKNTMKDWKASVRGWQSREKKQTPQPLPITTKNAKEWI